MSLADRKKTRATSNNTRLGRPCQAPFPPASKGSGPRFALLSTATPRSYSLVGLSSRPDARFMRATAKLAGCLLGTSICARSIPSMHLRAYHACHTYTTMIRVCVCVCVCVFTYVYTSSQHQTKARRHTCSKFEEAKPTTPMNLTSRARHLRLQSKSQ